MALTLHGSLKMSGFYHTERRSSSSSSSPANKNPTFLRTLAAVMILRGNPYKFLRFASDFAKKSRFREAFASRRSGGELLDPAYLES